MKQQQGITPRKTTDTMNTPKPYGPKTAAQIEALVEQGKIAIVATSERTSTDQPAAVLVERYDRQGRAHRETIEIKEGKTSRRPTPAQPEQEQPEEQPAAAQIDADVDEGYRDITARIVSINGTPYADVIAAETSRAAALQDRPIHSAEKKAKNRLDHAAARLAEAQAYHANAQAEYDAAKTAAEQAWLDRKAAQTTTNTGPNRPLNSGQENAIKP